MDRNIARLSAHLGRLGVPLRPHLKTAKCVDIARPMMATPAGPATVSTLKEAEEFAAAGVSDIVYAVGIAPSKLERALALRKASGVAGIGVRTIDDIALSVPANVIGHQPAKKQILVDAGWMACWSFALEVPPLYRSCRSEHWFAFCQTTRARRPHNTGITTSSVTAGWSRSGLAFRRVGNPARCAE